MKEGDFLMKYGHFDDVHQEYVITTPKTPLPGIPYGISILNIQIFAVDVCRYIIVTITGQTQQFGILIEGISAASVGYQTEKLV